MVAAAVRGEHQVEAGMMERVAVVMMDLVETDEATMAVAVAAAARPMAGLEGTTAEAATEADNQVANLEAATEADNQVASLEAATEADN